MSATDTIVEAYLECLLWSETDLDGTPLDSEYDITDLHPTALAEITVDIKSFMDDTKAERNELPDWYTPEQYGHDYCLTRNGHGAGFWDRGLPGTLGDRLSDKARSAGTMTPYVGDDGLIYVYV